eukprot:m.260663 g.260663  ORF g.260663 m.260663 type:complete len:333 (+) comp40424_c0_seq1:291-1289(+)
MAWRFDVDTSEVPKGDNSSKWEVSRNTNTAFKLLAATSCRILAGCKRRCIRSRASGYKQASTDTLSWISQTYNGRQVPCVKLQEMCIAMLKIQEKPTQRPNSAPLQQTSNGGLNMEIPHSRESDEDEGPWDAADSAFSDDLFKTGCVLFTQFYRERTKEIRLAYVCGYRDALDDIMKWGSRNRTPGQNSISAATLTGICTLMRSRATTRENGGTPQRASASLVSSASSSSSTSRTPLNGNLNLGGDVDVMRTQSTHTPSRSIVRPTPTSSPSRCVGSARSPLVRTPSSQNDAGLTDPMAMWLPGNSSKREFVMDTDDDDEPMLENPKRARFG